MRENDKVKSVISEINLKSESKIDEENIANVANEYFTNIGASQSMKILMTRSTTTATYVQIQLHTFLAVGHFTVNFFLVSDWLS